MGLRFTWLPDSATRFRDDNEKGALYRPSTWLTSRTAPRAALVVMAA